MNFTAAAGAEAIMALDSHDLCDSRHVSKNEEEEGTEERQFLGTDVHGFDAPSEFFKLMIEWVEE